MVQNLSNPDFDCLNDFERHEILNKNDYFDNEVVERLMYEYVESSCTNVKLRDAIMVYASELIRQLIKAHNLGQICPGKDDPAGGDLFQTSWAQIESTLYKYEARPHCALCYNNLKPSESLLIDEFWFADEVIKKIKRCPYCKERLTRDIIYYKGRSKVFNLWSQVARTCSLAYIKKESRDRKNSGIFRDHLGNKQIQQSGIIERFLDEADGIFKYNDEYKLILEAIKELCTEDAKPHEGLISKLVDKTQLPRQSVTGFFKMIRLRGKEFTDSPINEKIENMKDRMDQIDFEELE